MVRQVCRYRYEIHTGRSHGADLARPMFRLETGAEAAVDEALHAVADTLSAAVDLDALFGAAGRPNVATCPTA